jgi:hypothetical protein
MGVVGSPADINGLLARLGVGERDGKVVFDDRAPLAAIRRAITEVPGAAPDK